MPKLTVPSGGIVYRAGDPGDAAYLVHSGRIKLLRNSGDQSAAEVVSLVKTGQVFGDAEILTGDPRRETAEAASSAVIEAISRDALLDFLADNSDLLHDAIRLAIDAEADPEPEPAPGPVPANDAVPAATNDTLLTWKAEGVLLTAQLGAAVTVIDTLPFRVGRRNGEDAAEAGPGELILRDERPYNLSRRHFAIECDNGQYQVRDLESHHGTYVNGIRIGRRERSDTAPLVAGENRIVAGERSSPFRFLVVLAPR